MDEQLKPYHAQMELARGVYVDAQEKLAAAELQFKQTAEAFIQAVKSVHNVPDFSAK